ncbi:MAG: elongation factor 1-beta [Thermoprotei archaeon]|nr:MAG: elongation factor 1-beta [Thermoprotei archaeon]
MARVLVVVKVLPEDINIDLGELKDRIGQSLPEGYEIKGYDVEPIAFGLRALRLYIFMPENVEGGTEPLENAIASVSGVSQVEVEIVHRISD